MSADALMAKALAAMTEVDGPMAIEIVHRLADTGEIDSPLSIAGVADLLDISQHTLRYYERAGLVEVDRDAEGHRAYSAATIRRLVFATRMRLSGMGIRDLQHYISLVDAGEDIVEERVDMLLEHRDTIRRQIRELTLSLAATEYEITTYGGRTSDLGVYAASTASNAE